MAIVTSLLCKHIIQIVFLLAGMLTVTKYPDIVPDNTRLREQIVGRIQSFIQLPFLDCFFKNMHRYWYIAPMDVDEIFMINSTFKTYQHYISHVIDREPALSNSLYLTAEVAGYFQHYKPVNVSIPEYLPMFRYMKRDRFTTWGHRKSFQNPRTCLHAGYHACRPLKQSNLDCEHCGYRPVTLPPNEIVLHHYRDWCKRNTGCLTADEAIIDGGPLKGKFGPRLRARIETALKRVGYL